MRALELKGICKSFGTIVANDSVDLVVEKGSIHALIGENGAGKTTAMNIAAGLLQADRGEIWVQGVHKSPFRQPLDALLCGIGMVHQHFMLAGAMTAFENIVLGSGFMPFSKKKKKEELLALAKKFGILVDLDMPVECMSVGEQQRVEILKVLSRKVSLLICDEPTAVLTPQEVERFFDQLRLLKIQGTSVILITHKLHEVMRVADQVSVFRQGRVVAHSKVSDTNAEALAFAMLGSRVAPVQVIRRPRSADKVLELKNCELKPGAHVSFDVHAGEIVGIAGVEGNGQLELFEALMTTSSLKRSIVVDDRLVSGVIPAWSVWENFILGNQDTFFPHGVADKQKMRQSCMQALQEYGVKPLDCDARFGTLSGGNQQKVVIARALYQQPRCLIAAQPTRGVDLGAVALIHQKLLAARDAGCGIVLISSELEEIMSLSDRIFVLFRGAFVGIFTPDTYDEALLGRCMGGTH